MEIVVGDPRLPNCKGGGAAASNTYIPESHSNKMNFNQSENKKVKKKGVCRPWWLKRTVAFSRRLLVFF
jgi:hypothetical protein